MEVPKELPARTRSARQSVKRRSTRGPLEDDDPLAASQQAARQEETPSKTTNPLSPTASLLSPPGSGLRRPVSPSGSSRSPSRLQLDLSFLLQTSLYENISTDGALPPFLSDARKPTADTPLDSLISTYHFRQAADKAASELYSGTIHAQDHQQILELFRIRLCCLILIDQTKVAAHEARALSDYLSRNTRPGQQGPSTLVPWTLRLLLHRLQARVASDGRRSIMALYAMGSECRAQAASSSDEEETSLWRSRLLDIGLRVAAELVEIGEFDTAAQHLQSLEIVAEDPDMIHRRALLQLRIGNVSAAEETLALAKRDEADEEYKEVEALIHLGRGEYAAAADTYATLHTARPQDTLIANNYAVCLLYTGNMDLASSILNDLIDDKDTPLASGVLFNLATLYELATERAVDKKVRLVERVAARSAADGGWERTGAEFKL